MRRHTFSDLRLHAAAFAKELLAPVVPFLLMVESIGGNKSAAHEETPVGPAIEGSPRTVAEAKRAYPWLRLKPNRAYSVFIPRGEGDLMALATKYGSGRNPALAYGGPEGLPLGRW